MSKHTPGPWTFGHWGNHFWVSPDKSGQSQKVAQVIWDMGEAVEEGRENARLIAAAPELLTELKHVIRLLEPLENNGNLNVPGLATLNGARAAIAKAEGRP